VADLTYGIGKLTAELENAIQWKRESRMEFRGEVQRGDRNTHKGITEWPSEVQGNSRQVAMEIRRVLGLSLQQLAPWLYMELLI